MKLFNRTSAALIIGVIVGSGATATVFYMSNGITRRPTPLPIASSDDDQKVVARNEMVDVLLRALDDDEFRKFDPRSATHVIELLGELRIRQAIPGLLRLVSFTPLNNPQLFDRVELPNGKIEWYEKPNPLTLGGGPYCCLPALASLVRIGSPSIDPAIRFFCTPNSTMKTSDIVWLIKGIKGDTGIAVLKEALASEKDAGARERLQSAIRAYDEARLPSEILTASKLMTSETEEGQIGSPLDRYRETWRKKNSTWVR